KELMRASLGLDSKCEEALLFLGEIALVEGDKTEGQKLLSQLLLLNPKQARAKELIGTVDEGEALKAEITAIYQNLNNLNYYSLLDTTPEALRDDIQRAFHQKTKQFHPDRFFTHKDNTLKEQARTLYKRCVEAYMVLKSPMKKKEYDAQLGHAKKGDTQVRL